VIDSCDEAIKGVESGPERVSVREKACGRGTGKKGKGNMVLPSSLSPRRRSQEKSQEVVRARERSGKVLFAGTINPWKKGNDRWCTGGSTGGGRRGTSKFGGPLEREAHEQ